jgi:hypothetical protein
MFFKNREGYQAVNSWNRSCILWRAVINLAGLLPRNNLAGLLTKIRSTSASALAAASAAALDSAAAFHTPPQVSNKVNCPTVSIRETETGIFSLKMPVSVSSRPVSVFFYLPTQSSKRVSLLHDRKMWLQTMSYTIILLCFLKWPTLQ